MKENETGRICTWHWGKMKNAYIIIVEKPEGKIPVGRPRII
jgi:hypothetical protein